MTRNPLAVRASIVAAVSAVLNVIFLTGVIPVNLQAAIVTAVDLTGTAVLVVWTKGAVTPVADPRGANGEPLVPAITVAPAAPAGV